MHRWTHLCLHFFVHSVLCRVTCTVDQACVFFTYCLMQCYIHRWTQWGFPSFLCILFYAVLHAPFDTLTFLYILFDALLHAPLIKLVFFLFLYILFDSVLHAPLDTLVFSMFFCKYVLCSVTCTVGHTGVFRVFLTYCSMLCSTDRWTHWRLLYFCTHCLMQCFVQRSTNWCFPYFCTYCLMNCYMHRWTHLCFHCFIHIA